MPQYPYPTSGDPLDAVLPNTREYVTGSMLRPADERDGQATFLCTCPDCDEATRRHLVEVEVRAQGACATGDVGSAWTAQVSGMVDDSQWEHSVDAAFPYVCLPEGRHRLTVSGRFTGGGQTAAFETQSLDVPVTNYLVVALGDSYSSGEGSPAARATGTPWPFVDDDDRNDFEHLVPQGGRVTALWQRRSFEALSIVDSGIRKRIDPWISENMVHFEAHRSPFAPSSLAAMALEADSRDSSVTFVNLAETGATIARGALQPGCVAETSCAARFPASQIEQLKTLVEGRHIDALVLGFGGNDAGFADIAAALIVREPSLRGTPNYDYPSKNEIRAAIATGDWSVIDNTEEPVVGLDGLDAEYGRLNDALRSELGDALTGTEVFLLGYPAPHRKPGPASDTDSYCEFFRNIAPFLDERADTTVATTVFGKVGKYLHYWQLALNFRVRLRVDEDEAQFVETHFYQPLKQIQQAVAKAHGWRFVDMADRFARHSICAGRPYAIHRRDSYAPRLPPAELPNRWFRTGIEGFLVAGSVSGEIEDNRALLHPNEGGYREMSRLLLVELRQALYPQPRSVWAGATRDTIDGERCPDFDLPSCGPAGSACAPIDDLCLDQITRDSPQECRYATRRCERVICTPGDVLECAIPNGSGAQLCNEFGTAVGDCELTACNSGYLRVGDRCRRLVCDAGETKSCVDEIDDAVTAFRRCLPNRTGFGSCRVTECRPGFRASGDRCVSSDTPVE